MENINIDKYYTVGCMVGRFQTDSLHDGHKYVIESVLKQHKRVILFLGTSRVLGSKSDPLDYETRRLMINNDYPNVLVLPLPDHRDDLLWSKDLDRRIREVYPKNDVILYGGRDSFIKSYHGIFPTEEYEEFGKNISASANRKRISIEVENSVDFRKGVIYSTQNMYDKTYPFVQILCQNDNKIIMECKDGYYSIIGGHVTQEDSTLENACVRILTKKQFSVSNEKYFEYVSSQMINDWHFKGSGDKVMSTLYRCSYLSALEPNDKFVEVNIDTFTDITKIVEEHRELYQKIRQLYLIEKRAD